MPIIDDRTPNLNLPLPYADNMLEDDSTRLRDALGLIDTAVAAKASAASVTALTATVADKADLVAGKVPAGQLPAFVDDVIEVANFSALPGTGESGKIYVTLATNKTYRWSGSAYFEIASSPGSTDVVPEGSVNLYHTPARALASVPIATPTTLGKVMVGAGLGIDGDGLLFAAAGGGSVMSLQEVVPASNGVSSITVPGGYVVGTILVGFNGSFLSPTDFTATDGSTIGLVGFTAGMADAFVVVKLSTVVIGTLPAGSVGTTQLGDGTVTLAKLAAAAYGTSGSNKLLQLDGAGKLPGVDAVPTATINGKVIGYRDVPQVIQSADYTLALSDAGKHILHPSADTTARTFTVPANASVQFPVDTAITVVNQNAAGVITIQIASDTMRLAGQGTAGNRTLAANGICTLLKITATEWIISGSGLT